MNIVGRTGNESLQNLTGAEALALITAAPLMHASATDIYGKSTALLYGHAKGSSTTPIANTGTGVIGEKTDEFANADHAHPLQPEVKGGAGWAERLLYKRKIGIVGGAVAEAIEDDGTGDIYLELYGLDPNILDVPVPIEKGGTGAATAALALASLGADDKYALSGHGHALDSSVLTGALPISKGGTGAISATLALAALGADAKYMPFAGGTFTGQVVIGSNGSLKWATAPEEEMFCVIGTSGLISFRSIAESDVSGLTDDLSLLSNSISNVGNALTNHNHSLTSDSITGVLPIAKGGTGAISATLALAALGADAKYMPFAGGAFTGAVSHKLVENRSFYEGLAYFDDANNDYRYWELVTGIQNNNSSYPYSAKPSVIRVHGYAQGSPKDTVDFSIAFSLSSQGTVNTSLTGWRNSGTIKPSAINYAWVSNKLTFYIDFGEGNTTGKRLYVRIDFLAFDISDPGYFPTLDNSPYLNGWFISNAFSLSGTSIGDEYIPPSTSHSHVASDILDGVFDIALIPTGTTALTVALGNHNHTSLKSDTDNHTLATTPNDYNSKLIVAGLKTNSVIGLTPDVNSTYSTVIGIRGWSSSANGNSHELAFNGEGGIYARNGSTTTWGGWNRLLMSEDIGNTIADEKAKREVIETSVTSTTASSPTSLTHTSGKDTRIHIMASANYTNTSFYAQLPSLSNVTAGDRIECTMVNDGTYVATIIFNPNETTSMFKNHNTSFAGSSRSIKFSSGERIVFDAVYQGESSLKWRVAKFSENEF